MVDWGAESEDENFQSSSSNEPPKKKKKSPPKIGTFILQQEFEEFLHLNLRKKVQF